MSLKYSNYNNAFMCIYVHKSFNESLKKKEKKKARFHSTQYGKNLFQVIRQR